MATIKNATPQFPCLVAQVAINEAFIEHPGSLPASVGAYDALTAQTNRTGFVQTQSDLVSSQPTAESNRKVQVRYIPTDCDPEFEFDTCDLDSAPTPTYKTAELTANLSYGWGFDLSESEYRDSCDGGQQGQYGAMILSKYENAKRQFNNKITTALAALPGNYPTDGSDSLTSPKSIPVVTANGVYNPAGFGLIKSIFDAGNMRVDPILVGGTGITDMALNSLRYAIGNTSTGVGQNGSFLPNYFRDDTLNAQFGDGVTHLIGWRPGFVQLLEWYENVGEYRITEEQLVNGERRAKTQKDTIVTPDGIRWDFFYAYDCGVHKYRFRKYFGVSPIPDDAFGSSCQDFNGILHFIASCGDLDCNTLDAALAPGSGS